MCLLLSIHILLAYDSLDLVYSFRLCAIYANLLIKFVGKTFAPNLAIFTSIPGTM